MPKLPRNWAYFGFKMEDIRTARVFGTNGENVLIVLKNDAVLAFGKNQKGCLGAGVKGEVRVLKRIENLCGQGIEGFECAVYYDGDKDKFCMFAISASGSVFSWGQNSCGQLGLGTRRYTKVPTKISGSLEEKRVVQVACGEKHTLAMTSEGEVYAFGKNILGQLGLGTKDDHLLPRKVGGLLDGKIVTSIACQSISSFALLHSGEICSWGYNSDGRLGFTSNSNLMRIPGKVLGFEGVVISKIVCGDTFTLALSTDRRIYAWGKNEESQLGNGTTYFLGSPTIISTKIGRIKDIAASHYFTHPCAAITENNQVYIWGRVNGQIIKTPELTSHSSFDELFTASYPVTYQSFRLKESENTKDENNQKGPSTIERIRKAFDNPETADVVFIVEGKKIHAHRNLLTIGSGVFKTLFLGNWKDSSKKEQTVEDHSYDAFYAFLKYFYTNEVDFTPQLALEVYDLAHFYLVTDLMEECETILKSGLTVQNAAAVYERAILFGAKDLCEFCFEFCREHLVCAVNDIESDESKRKAFLEVFRLVADEKKKN